MESMPEGMDGRSDMAGDNPIKILPRNEYGISELWNNFRWPNICVIRVTEEEERKEQKILKKKMI